jgi:hypothetical protein
MFAKFASYYDGKSYQFAITSEMLERCPRWDPDQTDHPPLSAAKALAKAREFVTMIKTQDQYFGSFSNCR